MLMSIQKNRSLIISVCVVALVLLSIGAYFLYQYFWGPKVVPISTYVCADGSHYVVIEKGNALFVSNSTFVRIEDGERRYSNGSAEIEIKEDLFTLKDTETGTEIVTCSAGVPETGLPTVQREQQ